ncbi:hypothetical protein ACJMK2_037453 [Sinanodonta woodiana]|uniref:Uncharacterized protein n=1 Tax=Sinanodonta woodiana TaxID=1069815 RepID=A0ABD3WLS3_SINWO
MELRSVEVTAKEKLKRQKNAEKVRRWREKQKLVPLASDSLKKNDRDRKKISRMKQQEAEKSKSKLDKLRKQKREEMKRYREQKKKEKKTEDLQHKQDITKMTTKKLKKTINEKDTGMEITSKTKPKYR